MVRLVVVVKITGAADLDDWLEGPRLKEVRLAEELEDVIVVLAVVVALITRATGLEDWLEMVSEFNDRIEVLGPIGGVVPGFARIVIV